MSAAAKKHYRYTFGEFTLDTRRGALKKNGDEIKIRAQSFKVLLYLLSRHRVLTSKEELHREIWGKKVVSDDSLTHCLLDIRKCLGDTEKNIIRTISRRGYIFDAPCEIEPLSATHSGSLQQRAQRRRLAGSAIAVVFITAMIWQFVRDDAESGVVLHNSIAVLPFVDMSQDQNQRYLADGLSDEVLNLLARSPDLRVIARTSSFSFADTPPDVATIRELLRVAYVLEGSVRRTQDQLQITARLVDTATSTDIWSNTYEGRPDNLVALQKDIADAVLSAIAPDADGSRIVSAQRSFSADELMLLARFYEQEVRERAEVDASLLEEAIGLYRGAVQADPLSALAHSRLAGVLLYAGDLAGAETPILTAHSLDPNLSEVQETLGEYYWLSGLPGAGAAWKRAIELNPNNADALSAFAYWYWMQAFDDGPEELFRSALELDPLSLARHAALGDFLANQARVEKTHELIIRIQNRFDSPESYRVIARLLELIGEVDQSIAWTIKARDRDPGNGDHVAALAELYAELGDFETALKLEPDPGVGLLFKMRRYAELIDQAEFQMIEEPGDIYLRYLLAFSYNVKGKPDAAIRILRQIGQPMTRAETRQPVEVEGFVTYIDALEVGGEADQATELAQWFIMRRHTESNNWWIHVYRACTLSILARDEEALIELDRVLGSPRLPWSSTLNDLQCFQRYRDEPRYQAVLDDAEVRRANLLLRLPETLAAHSVEL